MFCSHGCGKPRVNKPVESSIKLPRIYLLKRSAVQDEAVQHSLRITPVKAILAIHPDDQKAVEESSLAGSVPVSVTTDGWGPIVIVAEGFDQPLYVVDEDGKLEIVCPSQPQSNQ